MSPVGAAATAAPGTIRRQNSPAARRARRARRRGPARPARQGARARRGRMVSGVAIGRAARAGPAPGRAPRRAPPASRQHRLDRGDEHDLVAERADRLGDRARVAGDAVGAGAVPGSRRSPGRSRWRRRRGPTRARGSAPPTPASPRITSRTLTSNSSVVPRTTESAMHAIPADLRQRQDRRPPAPRARAPDAARATPGLAASKGRSLRLTLARNCANRAARYDSGGGGRARSASSRRRSHRRRSRSRTRSC